MQELCERDILEFRHGSGTYVKPRRKLHNASYHISVVLFEKNFRSSYCSYAMQGFQCMAAEYGWQLHLSFHSYGQLKQNYDESVFQNRDALVFLGCYDTYDLSYLPKHLPCIGLEMHNSLNGQFSTVTLDPFDAAVIAAEHFRSLGIRHVKIISADTPVHHEAYAQEYFRKHKKYLAENPAVLSIDGKSLIAPDFQPANTIAIDWPAAGEAAAEECLRRLKSCGSNARRIYLTPKLYLYHKNGEEK